MNRLEDPAEVRLRNVIDMGLNFSAMLRLYTPGSKKELYQRIFSEIKQLFQAKPKEQFTIIHSRICDWGVGDKTLFSLCDVRISPSNSVKPNVGGIELADALARVLPFTAKGDDRPVLACVNFVAKDGKLTLVSADGNAHVSLS